MFLAVFTRVQTLKRTEREVGRIIEKTTRENCAKWREEEKRVVTDGGLEVSFDQGSQKQGRARDQELNREH